MAVQKLNEQPIKTVITNLLIRHGKEPVVKDDIMFEIIKYQKLDQNNAEAFFQAMLKLGLGNAVEIPGTSAEFPTTKFSISVYAIMRNYYTENEIDRFEDKRKQRRGKSLR